VDSARWHRVRDLFARAVEREPEGRAAFLDDACGEDRGLRAEVEELLESYGQAGDFLEAPAGAVSNAHDQLRVGPGTRLGPYEIVELLGAGGMGEVYRARDDRLGRDVAVKVLPPDLAWSAGRLERFEQEARAASALNHPHILAVYDVGHHAGVHYLVTELLEGRTLDQRMAQGAPPLRKTLEWAAQAARGLTEAHERGIVHCDLKPSNLFVTSAGQLKILDFGLARLGPDPDTPEGPFPPMGTMGYMSPEQARGEAMDFRSDQFSFGCVLYELITGTAPFQRATPAEILAAVLQDEPPALAEVQPRLPTTVAWIVERCLAKDKDDRYAATRDLARDLELSLGRLSELSQPTTPQARRPAKRFRAGLVVPAVLALAAGVGAGWWAWHEPPAVPVVRYLTYSGRESSPAAAPDGKTVAFSSSRDGRRRIWLKQLATGSEAPLTDGVDDSPRFSPDGSVVVFARTEAGRVSLYRVPSVGGEPRRLVDDALYGDYSPDGRRIAFVRPVPEAAGTATVVGTANADGSNVRELARLDARRFPRGAFVNPRWSPDGRYLAATQSTLQLGAPTVIALLDTETGQVRELSPPSEAGVWRGGLAWLGPGRVVCAQPESVVGQQTGTSSRLITLDVASGRTRPLLWSPVNILALDVLGSGRLVLGTRSLRQHLREVSLDPRQPGERWLTRGNSADRQPAYAPDGEWIAFSSNRSGNLDLWEVSRRSGAVRRLTEDPAHDSDPGFLPDGRLVWTSNRSGVFEVWMAEADGTGARQVTRDGVDAENPVATPDGQWIVYASANPRSPGIMKIRPDGRDATLVVRGNLIEPEVSPDGGYVAFVADSGSEETTLRIVRMSDGALVSRSALTSWVPGSGIDQGRSRWRPDGRALAYIDQEKDGRYVVYEHPFTPGTDTHASRRRLAALEGDLSAESLGFSADGSSLTVSYREQLFDLMLAEDVPAIERARR
jgi:Tol biopolymer transport system component